MVYMSLVRCLALLVGNHSYSTHMNEELLSMKVILVHHVSSLGRNYMEQQEVSGHHEWTPWQDVMMSYCDISHSPLPSHPNAFFVIHLLSSYLFFLLPPFSCCIPFYFFFISQFSSLLIIFSFYGTSNFADLFALCSHHSCCFVIRLACVLVEFQCLFLQMVHCPLLLSTAAPVLLTELEIKRDCQVHPAALLPGCIPRPGKSRDILLYTQPNPTQTVANAFTQKRQKRGEEWNKRPEANSRWQLSAERRSWRSTPGHPSLQRGTATPRTLFLQWTTA